ncbi:eclosion hormone [Venturia canescens]|uniref:eclosion hormone n=1 Tax=Venturia canescens TaxID=32260 RepID=UPI001C9C525E|nr:eclosion hormone [Venturia canescens]
MNIRLGLISCALLLATVLTTPATATRVGTCLRNCAQCTKMFGRYFDGQLCADTCVKYKGKMIPDCEDENSITDFINRLDDV